MIGAYEILGRIAVGGDGREVLLGKSPSGQPVAIKKVPHSAGRGSTARHPNLVGVIEIVQIGDELLEKVWGMQASPTSRTVDNFIVKLRRKLEEDQKNPRHILTVYGFGYKLVL